MENTTACEEGSGRSERSPAAGRLRPLTHAKPGPGDQQARLPHMGTSHTLTHRRTRTGPRWLSVSPGHSCALWPLQTRCPGLCLAPVSMPGRWQGAQGLMAPARAAPLRSARDRSLTCVKSSLSSKAKLHLRGSGKSAQSACLHQHRDRRAGGVAQAGDGVAGWGPNVLPATPAQSGGSQARAASATTEGRRPSAVKLVAPGWRPLLSWRQ